jgi:hypothetical protein
MRLAIAGALVRKARPTINTDPSGVVNLFNNSNNFAVDSANNMTIYGESFLCQNTCNQAEIQVYENDDPNVTIHAITYAADGQINVGYSIGSGATAGQHCVYVETPYCVSNCGSYMVGDFSPTISSISQTSFVAGTSTPNVQISGTNFGTNCPKFAITPTAAGSTFVPASCADTQITGTMNIDPNAAAGQDTVTLTAEGFNSQGFLPAQSSETQSATTTISVTPPPPPTVSVSLNGATVSANSTIYINSTPALPLVASLVPGQPGVPLSGNATWEMDIDYAGPGAYQYSCTLTATTAANGSWSIGGTFGGQFCGGSAVVKGTYQGHTATLAFTILGQNAPAATVKSTLGASPWFIQQLANSESPGYLQFQSNGQPVYGAPNGFGIMQLDYHNNVYELWTWTTNVGDGLSLNTSNGTAAATFWASQLTAWQKYNATPGNEQVPMQANVSDGPCVFSYTPSGGQHPFSDGIWIKMYNSGSSYPFIQWAGSSWSVSLTNNYGFDYIGRVCSTTP